MFLKHPLQPRACCALITATALSLVLLPSLTHATDGELSRADIPIVDWGDASNWYQGMIAEGNGAIANITTMFTGADRTINLTGANRTIGMLTIGYTAPEGPTPDTRNYIFSSTDGSGFIFNNNGNAARIDVSIYSEYKITSGSTTITAPVLLQDSLEIYNTTATPVMINGVISATGNQQLIVGYGDVTLSAANTYTGGTVINEQARLFISSDANLGDASSKVHLNSGTLANTATIYVADGREFVLGSHGGTFQTDSDVHIGNGAFISGSGSLIKIGDSTLAFDETAVNTYSHSTIIREGTISIESDHNLGAVTATVLMDGGTLSTNKNVVLDAERSIFINDEGGTITNNHALDINGQLEGGGLLTKNGIGTLSLNNDTNSHTGSILVNEGKLRIRGGDRSLGSIYNKVILANDTTFIVHNKAGINNTFISYERTFTLLPGTVTFEIESHTEFGATIDGSGKLIKTGSETLDLRAGNEYTGGTEVSSGTLLVNNPYGSATGTGDVVVRAGAALGGGGSIAGETTLESGSQLHVKDNLRFGDKLTLAGSTNMTISNDNRGFGYDAIDVALLLTYGGDLNIHFDDLFYLNFTYELFHFFDGYAGSFDSVNISGVFNVSLVNDGNGKWTGTYDGYDISFYESLGSLIIVPEPTTVALVLAAAASGIAVIARRKKTAASNR